MVGECESVSGNILEGWIVMNRTRRIAIFCLYLNFALGALFLLGTLLLQRDGEYLWESEIWIVPTTAVAIPLGFVLVRRFHRTMLRGSV